ncbi:MAG: hypothetical protein V1817_00855 [Candidatus Micrarchaeota archaeon]
MIFLGKPRVVKVEEKPVVEREPPSETEFDFKEIFLPRKPKEKT